jgi:hypothetical protein
MEYAVVILKITEEFDEGYTHYLFNYYCFDFSKSDLKTGKFRVPSDDDWAAVEEIPRLLLRVCAAAGEAVQVLYHLQPVPHGQGHFPAHCTLPTRKCAHSDTSPPSQQLLRRKR